MAALAVAVVATHPRATGTGARPHPPPASRLGRSPRRGSHKYEPSCPSEISSLLRSLRDAIRPDAKARAFYESIVGMAGRLNYICTRRLKAPAKTGHIGAGPRTRDGWLMPPFPGHDPGPDGRRNRRARASAEGHDRRRSVPALAAHSDFEGNPRQAATGARTRAVAAAEELPAAARYSGQKATGGPLALKSEQGPPATLGSSAAADVRLIVWCRDCSHQVDR